MNVGPKYQFVLFDNNVFDLITRPDAAAKYRRLYNTLREIEPALTQAEIAITPACLLEFLGIVVPKPKGIFPDKQLEEKLVKDRQKINRLKLSGKPRDADLDREHSADVQRYVFDFFKSLIAFYREVEILKPDLLEARMKEQLAHVSPALRQELLWPLLKADVLDAEYRDEIARTLAVDRLLAHDFRGSIKESILPILNLRFSDFLRIGHNLSLFRLSNANWNHFIEKVRHSEIIRELADQGEKAKILENFSRAQAVPKLDGGFELLDVDIIHHAVVGKARSGETLPVICVTMDNIDQVRLRIGQYRSFVQRLQHEYPETLAGVHLPLAPGVVLVVDKNLKTVGKIKVQRTRHLMDTVFEFNIARAYDLKEKLT